MILDAQNLAEIRELQRLIDYRTQVENQAIKLISQCRYDEAQLLLSTLDSVESLYKNKEQKEKVCTKKLTK